MKNPASFAFLLSAVLVAACAMSVALGDEVEGVSQSRIEPDFAPILESHPFLMQEGGAMFLRLPGGTNVLFAVGYTDRRTTAKPAQEARRQRRVAEAKARRAVTEALHGIQVRSFVQTTEKTVVRREGDKEVVVEDLTELLEKSETEVSGWIPGLPVVGTWVLTENNLFCLAVGRIFPPAAGAYTV